MGVILRAQAAVNKILSLRANMTPRPREEMTITADGRDSWRSRFGGPKIAVIDPQDPHGQPSPKELASADVVLRIVWVRMPIGNPDAIIGGAEQVLADGNFLSDEYLAAHPEYKDRSDRNRVAERRRVRSSVGAAPPLADSPPPRLETEPISADRVTGPRTFSLCVEHGDLLCRKISRTQKQMPVRPGPRTQSEMSGPRPCPFAGSTDRDDTLSRSRFPGCLDPHHDRAPVRSRPAGRGTALACRLSPDQARGANPARGSGRRSCRARPRALRVRRPGPIFLIAANPFLRAQGPLHQREHFVACQQGDCEQPAPAAKATSNSAV